MTYRLSVLLIAAGLHGGVHAATLSGNGLPSAAHEFMLNALEASGNATARVSSTERSAARQAELILAAIERDGVPAAQARYGSAGDAVIAVYVANQAGMQRPQLLAAMTAEVNAQVTALGPNRTQLMHIPPSQHVTFDVAPSSLANASAFAQQLSGHPHVARHFVPGAAEAAYHIELPRTLQPVSGSYPGRCGEDGEWSNFTLTLTRQGTGYAGGISGNGLSLPLHDLNVDQKAQRIRFELRNDGESAVMNGSLANYNRRISVGDGDGLRCEWQR